MIGISVLGSTGSIGHQTLDVLRAAPDRYRLVGLAAGHADDVPEQDGVDLVRSLIEKGARIDAADNRGRTALMIAAEQGHGAIASALIEAGADRTLRDKDGKTAADLASDDATRVALAAH